MSWNAWMSIYPKTTHNEFNDQMVIKINNLHLNSKPVVSSDVWRHWELQKCLTNIYLSWEFALPSTTILSNSGHLTISTERSS